MNLRQFVFKLRRLRSLWRSIDRQATVEQVLLDVANMKRPPPTPDECRDLALFQGCANGDYKRRFKNDGSRRHP